MQFQFKSELVTTDRNAWGDQDTIQKVCNDWAREGWEVFSVVCPQPSNWTTYRLTARRQVGGNSQNDGRKFR